MVMPNRPSGRMCIFQTVYCSKSFASQKTEQIEYNSEREVPETEKQHVNRTCHVVRFNAAERHVESIGGNAEVQMRIRMSVEASRQ